MADLTLFNKRDVYERDIKPHVDQIIKVCVINKIPFLSTCVVESAPSYTKYANNGYLTGSSDIHLADDQFERQLLVMRGAQLAPFTADPTNTDEFWEYIATPPVEEDSFVEENEVGLREVDAHALMPEEAYVIEDYSVE